MKYFGWILVFLALSVNAWAAPSKDFERFANFMAKNHHFNKAEVVKLLHSAEEIHPVQQQVASPVTNLPWYKFKPLFVNQRRIDNGIKFWNENKEALTRASETYGVAPSVIVAIIGIETKYGSTIGNFRTFDALVTLAFYTPKSRHEYFRDELKEFMLLSREQGWNPREVYGSYAGALGLPQFMPSTYHKKGIDFDQDGKIDLMHNPTDAIGSVARFLSDKGWVKDRPMAAESDCKEEPEGYVKKIKPSISMRKWTEQCDVIVVDADDYSYYNYPASLFYVEIEENVKQFWNGFDNFYAIFHYNPSINYVMSVMTLAGELEKVRSEEITNE